MRSVETKMKRRRRQNVNNTADQVPAHSMEVLVGRNLPEDHVLTFAAAPHQQPEQSNRRL